MFKELTQFQQRLLSGTISGVLVFLVIYLSQLTGFKPIFTAAVAAVIGLAMWELFHIAQEINIEPANKLGISLSAIYACTVALSTQYAFAKQLPEIVLLAALLVCFLYYFVKGNSPFINLSTTLFGIGYLAVPLSCLISIAYFFPAESAHGGRWWLLYLIVVTKVTDMGAYFIGMGYGKQKLAPYISPKKTWEGAIGGLLCAVAASAVINVLSSFTSDGTYALDAWQTVWLGLTIGVFAQCGDLAESLLKRDCGVKDSNRLPGLGGMLDMVDSLVFTAPLVYIWLKIQFPGTL